MAATVKPPNRTETIMPWVIVRMMSLLGIHSRRLSKPQSFFQRGGAVDRRVQPATLRLDGLL